MSKWRPWPWPWSRKLGQNAEVTKFKLPISRTILNAESKCLVFRDGVKHKWLETLTLTFRPRNLAKYQKYIIWHGISRLVYEIQRCCLNYSLQFLMGHIYMPSVGVRLCGSRSNLDLKFGHAENSIYMYSMRTYMLAYIRIYADICLYVCFSPTDSHYPILWFA